MMFRFVLRNGWCYWSSVFASSTGSVGKYGLVLTTGCYWKSGFVSTTGYVEKSGFVSTTGCVW